jgi:hypothetical protein
MNGLLSPDDMMMAGPQGTPNNSDALMQSLYGMGDYADAGMILPFAITPQGERVLSFPAPIQSVARTVARGMGAMPLETDPYTGMLSENVLADAAEAAGLFTGAGLLAPKPAGAIGMSGGGGVTRTIPPRQVDDLGFYSQALEAAARLPQAKGTGQQMEAMLTKAGVKPDEIAFTPGLRGLLDQPQVTREELVGLLQEKQIRPQETVFEGGDPDFEAMNFPAQAEVLDVYKAFGSDYVNEQADELLFYNTEYLLDAIGDIPKRTQYGEIPDTKEQITQALLDGNIDELDTNTEIFLRQKAEQLAIDQYNYDPVLRLQDPDTGYEIVGSDEMGYTIRDSGGNPIDPQGNDIPYSLSEARIQAENHAMDAGLVGYGDGGETRFSEYTEPSGTNYREILLQVPEYEGMRDEFVQRGHFDEANIAVHARTKDRDTEGGTNDVLYVEELQSDWGQQGRDKGFSTKESIDKKRDLEAAITPLMDEQMRLSKQRDKLIEDYGAKIADKEAAKSPLNEDGMYYSRYGSVYRLEPDESSVLVLPRSQVEEILQLSMDQAYPFRPGKETDWEIEAGPKYNELSSKIKDLSSQIKPIKDELSGLPSGPQKGPLVGNTEKFAEAGIKRLLIRAANEGKRYVSFSPGDLQADRWNNPGLEVYYDEIIPKVAKKVAKRFDKDAFTGNKYVEELGDRFTIEITPKMRAAIQEGVPLFVTGGQGLLAAGEGMRQQPQQGILY